MLDDYHTVTTQTCSHEILANRLLQLADDTDRVGLHREANVLAIFAASVLEGRRITIRDA